jgi:hypothetical protein
MHQLARRKLAFQSQAYSGCCKEDKLHYLPCPYRVLGIALAGKNSTPFRRGCANVFIKGINLWGRLILLRAHNLCQR